MNKSIKKVIDNNEFVCANYLSFITNSIYGDVWYKFHIKFVQSMRSLSFNWRVNNHYSHKTNNPKQILKKSIIKSLDTGLLRLELIYYIKNPAMTKEYINERLTYLGFLLLQENIF